MYRPRADRPGSTHPDALGDWASTGKARPDFSFFPRLASSRPRSPRRNLTSATLTRSRCGAPQKNRPPRHGKPKCFHPDVAPSHTARRAQDCGQVWQGRPGVASGWQLGTNPNLLTKPRVGQGRRVTVSLVSNHVEAHTTWPPLEPCRARQARREPEIPPSLTETVRVPGTLADSSY